MIFGVMHERAGDRHALLLAAARAGRVFGRLLGNLHPRRAAASRGSSASPCGMLAAPSIGASVQVLEHGQVREQVEVLEHHADLGARIVVDAP
jgi:hypothetical protein